MGRAAAVNGNGRAVLPPAELAPVRRYRQPPPPSRSMRSKAARAFGWILVALVIVVSGLGGGVYLYGHETLQAIAAHTPGVVASQKDLKAPTASEPATALLIGYDARAGSGGFGAADSRSDTIMLVRADPTTNTLSLLSFPRDLQVPIYCDPTTALRTDRINSAWTTCKNFNARGTLDTVEKLTGVSVNYVITIDFHGFKLLVNRLHGVYVDVDQRYYIAPHSGTAAINLEPGYQKLDGQQALDFARFRETDSDLYRNARQQLFVESLKDRLASTLSVFQIPKIIGALKNNVEIGRGGGGGAPSLSEIQAYAGLAFHLGGGHLFRVTIPNLVSCGYLNAQICASQSDIDSAVQSFEHPDVNQASVANDVALGIKPKQPKQPPLKPAEISALVLNGTYQAGLARDTSFKLAQLGYHTVQLPSPISADAPTKPYGATIIYYDQVQPSAKQAATEVAAAFGKGTQIQPLTPEIAPLAQQAGNPYVVAVVGSSFSGDLIDPTAHVAPPPVHHPPVVRNDPGAALQPILDVRSKLHLRPLVPHVVESSSRLSSRDGVRAYKPAPGHHALALTFVTGAGNVYWQIMETDWTSAPVLRRPTAHVTLAGRKYVLYTTGGNIHMVVLRQGGMSYWVVNTLRDELSNETMLAIAKGLQPLGK